MTMKAGMEARKRTCVEFLWDCKLVNLFWESFWRFIQVTRTRIFIQPVATSEPIPKDYGTLAYPYSFLLYLQWLRGRFNLNFFSSLATEETMKT